MNTNADMNTNQIERRHFKEGEYQRFKDAHALNAAGYFEFLIKEGARLSLVTAEQLESLQYQLIELLAEQFNRWTGGQSSSVSVETGQRIQQSVFYTIGYHLKSLPDEERAFAELKGGSLRELFLQGKQRIGTVRKEAEALLLELRENRFSTDLRAYNDTLAAGLPMFFSSYDMDYGAHETPASVDYPLGNDKMNLSGIEYIYDYLRKLQMENSFCTYFSNDDIHGLMRNYDRQYRELLFNVYDLVLTNAVGRLLLGRDDMELRISDWDLQYLQSSLSPLPEEQLCQRVDQAIGRLCELLSISDGRLSDYIRSSAANLKSRLNYGLKTGGLRRLFLSSEEAPQEPVILFEDKEKLDDDSFRRLADEIRECRLVSDKIALLRRASTGIADLIDLLEGDCFFGEEYCDVFTSLEDVQLALLKKRLSLDPASADFLEEENRREWQSRLHDFLIQKVK